MSFVEEALAFAKDIALTAASAMLEDNGVLTSIIDDNNFPINFGCPFIGIEDCSGDFRSPFFDDHN